MAIAKIFMSGRSQAVRLPKDFRFNDDEVEIKKIGNSILLSPKNNVWDDFLNTPTVTDDFVDIVLNNRDNSFQNDRVSL